VPELADEKLNLYNKCSKYINTSQDVLSMGDLLKYIVCKSVMPVINWFNWAGHELAHAQGLRGKLAPDGDSQIRRFASTPT